MMQDKAGETPAALSGVSASLALLLDVEAREAGRRARPVGTSEAQRERGPEGGPTGLVSSDKTPAETESAWDVPALVGYRFPSPDLVSASAGLLESARQRGAARGESASWASRESIAWRITVAPGLLRVSTRAVGRPDPVDVATEGRARLWDMYDDDVRDRLPVVPVDVAGVLDADAASSATTSGTRQAITEWSAKSRVAMIARLSTLDYGPLVDSGRAPAMLTLTLPKDWRTVAPTGRHFKKAMNRFLERYRTAWGHRLVGIWKLEFQRRGAAHLHILMTPPHGRAHARHAADRLPFGPWVSRAWAAAVAHPDPEERRKHVLAGTSVDYAEGMRSTDPRRVAVYFVKHSAPGGAASKEYQHNVPKEWQEPGAGPGRFWGVWGLDVVEHTVEVAPRDAVMAARILRRHSRAKGATRRVKVFRPDVDKKTGEQRKHHRVTTRRAVRMRGGRGFVCLNDAPAMLSQIARYLDLRASWPPDRALTG